MQTPKERSWIITSKYTSNDNTFSDLLAHSDWEFNPYPALHSPLSHLPAPFLSQLLQSDEHSGTDKATLSSFTWLLNFAEKTVATDDTG